MLTFNKPVRSKNSNVFSGADQGGIWRNCSSCSDSSWQKGDRDVYGNGVYKTDMDDTWSKPDITLIETKCL